MKARPALGTYCLRGLILLNCYILSFILISEPSEDNRARDEYWGTIVLEDKVVYPSGTLLCCSQSSRLNELCYWVYWPLHSFLSWRELIYFVRPSPGDVSG